MSVVEVHGTARNYRLGCRCDECRQAHTDYCRILGWRSGRRRPMAERAVEADARRNHGSETRYNRGCRCQACKDGAAAARRARREREAERVAHEQSLEWVRHWPEYRELIRQRISEAQKRRRRIDASQERHHADVDYIGRPIEGCG